MHAGDREISLFGANDFRVEEVNTVTPELVNGLLEIDLQTFSESTFSEYAAAAMLRNGRVFLLRAGDVLIGSLVTMRCWDRPNEVMVLSMGIKPGWRGQGLGQSFITEVLERLRARGLRSVCLYVGNDNRRAIKVYQDVGFQAVEIGTVGQLGEQLMLMRSTLQEDSPVVEL